VRQALVSESAGHTVVEGAVASSNALTEPIRARVTIATDGRRSTLAFGLGLARHPVNPRRWAIGAYFEENRTVAPLGEMHVRRGRYIGVAPLAGNATNVCLVKPASGDTCEFRDPAALLAREIATEPELRDRFAGARLLHPPTMLGPLAVDGVDRWVDGLLLAGDAAGFIDPMTGDGLRFAVRGAELEAEAALRVLEHGWSGVHAALASARRREFGPKWRFNRTLRALVASPAAVHAATLGASLAQLVVRRLIVRAGDCEVATRIGAHA
jgi:flavin-dependent dehydrogenase